MEILDLGTQLWTTLARGLPFNAHSLTAVTLNSEETLLYGGFVLTSNQDQQLDKAEQNQDSLKTTPGERSRSPKTILRRNTKTIIFNSQTRRFKEWMDLRDFVTSPNCQDVVAGWDSSCGVLYFIYKHIHSEVAFESKFDLLAFDFKNRVFRSFINLSDHLTDDFQKQIFDPVSFEFTDTQM